MLWMDAFMFPPLQQAAVSLIMALLRVLLFHLKFSRYSRLLSSIPHLIQINVSNHTPQQVGYDLGCIALEKPIAILETSRRYVVGINIDDSNSCPLHTRMVNIPGSGVYLCRCANNHDEIDASFVRYKRIYIIYN